MIRDPTWKPLLHKNQKKWKETYKNENMKIDFSVQEQEQENNNKNQEYLSQV